MRDVPHLHNPPTLLHSPTHPSDICDGSVPSAQGSWGQWMPHSSSQILQPSSAEPACLTANSLHSSGSHCACWKFRLPRLGVPNGMQKFVLTNPCKDSLVRGWLHHSIAGTVQGWPHVHFISMSSWMGRKKFASYRKILNKMVPCSLSLFFGSLICDMFSKVNIKQIEVGVGLGDFSAGDWVDYSWRIWALH